jgi:hypothetical protein
MKNLFYNTALNAPASYGANSILSHAHNGLIAKHGAKSLLSPEAVYQMVSGQIPDLWDICLAISSTFNKKELPYSPHQLMQVMKDLPSLESLETKRFTKNPEIRHVLMSNEAFDLVLIHWKPGKASDIHGHPGGACAFKLLEGKLEELRYTPESSPKLISMNSYRRGNVAYIDDSMAYHQVGNPYGSSAISLHLYLK